MEKNLLTKVNVRGYIMAIGMIEEQKVYFYFFQKTQMLQSRGVLKELF